MARTATFEITGTEKGWQVNIPAKHSGTGARQRRYFETQGEAEGFVRLLGVQIQNYGLSAQLLKPNDAEQASAAMRLLAEAGADVGLLDVVRFYLSAEKRRTESRPLLEVFAAFLASKRRSEKYVASLKKTLARLGPLHATLIADVTSDSIEKILAGTADTYRNALLREIRALFTYAMKRGWCVENPVARMDFARVKVGEREIYTVTETQAILEAAASSEPALLPFVAIGLFAGVRVYEAMRLEWKHIDLTEGSIDLPASITKRERRRSIPIEPALRAWLEHAIGQLGIIDGPVTPYRTYNALRAHLRTIFKVAGVDWRQNAARHSYASYWLAEHQDLNRLALALGHSGGLEVLHMHYHRAVKRADAAKFWASSPAQRSQKVIRLAAGAVA